MTKQSMIEQGSLVLKTPKSRDRIGEYIGFVYQTLSDNKIKRKKVNGLLPRKSKIKVLRDNLMFIGASEYQIPVLAISEIFEINYATARYAISNVEIDKMHEEKVK